MSLNNEIQDIRTLMEKKADKDMKPILQAYKRSLDRTRTEIAKIHAQYSVDGVLKVGKKQRYTVLKQLEKQLLSQAKELGNIDLNHTTKILSDVYEESFYRSAFTIDKGIDTNINFSILRPEFVERAVNTPIEGKMFSDRIWANKEKLVNSVRNKVERGMIDGIDIRKLSREVTKEFEVSAYQSKRLIVTELGRVQGQAQKDIYESSGVVQKIMWSSTLDDLTRDEHRDLDGQTWDINDPNKKYAPDGVNCRCATIPVVDGWKPTRRRENVKNKDGEKEIIDYSSYENWKESKNIS
jgi:SPP1 gp7 family putative phage head morphogenesis protein